MMIILKSKEEIEIMRKAGRVVSEVLDMAGDYIKPGITTAELDAFIEKEIIARNAIPGFKNYQGFPAASCLSINDEVVHGIPGERIISEGDIVSVDVGSIVEGFYGDSARTFSVGKISDEKQALMDNTRRSLMAGIDKARKGNKLGEVSAEIQKNAESEGYGVVRQLVGHGIGRNMHEEPQVPNFGSPDEGPTLKIGMVIAIEPMINMGTYQVKSMPDGWTIVTADGQPSAHFEHTIAITDGQPDILSLSEG
ncbi:MAG: type I methionyl aminopeptidase [Candidatus Zixiibacteriota bacterium]|nr:MAG: type I methionyl aminopeptidase [candidate division Zixibacteria bacterium]